MKHTKDDVAAQEAGTRISYLALDLDGTLTNSKKQITPRTWQAIMQAQERGVCVILASGRPVCGQHHLAEQLRLADHGGYILAFNGGVILSCADGQILDRVTLPHDLLPEIIGGAQQAGFHVLSYQGDVMLSDQAENPYVQYAARINRMQLQQADRLAEALVEPVPKCIIVGEPESLQTYEVLMQRRYEGRLSVTRSEPFFLEVMPAGIDKAARLDVLLQRLGSTPDELMAIGDGFNDLSMLHYAGTAVAMGNAQPALKEAADFVTSSNDEDGIALALEHYSEKLTIG